MIINKHLVFILLFSKHSNYNSNIFGNLTQDKGLRSFRYEL